MNKDIIELLKYIGKIILIYSMPFFLFFLIFAACKITNAIHLKYNAFSVFGIILVIAFAILTIDFYFTLPYKITRKALRENKNKYLNQFAQNFGLTTILLAACRSTILSQENKWLLKLQFGYLVNCQTKQIIRIFD